MSANVARAASRRAQNTSVSDFGTLCACVRAASRHLRLMRFRSTAFAAIFFDTIHATRGMRPPAAGEVESTKNAPYIRRLFAVSDRSKTIRGVPPLDIRLKGARGPSGAGARVLFGLPDSCSVGDIRAYERAYAFLAGRFFSYKYRV